MQAASEHIVRIKTAGEKKIAKDIRILGDFTEAYCRAKHGDVLRRHFHSRRYFTSGGPELCDDCTPLLGYAIGKRKACPMDPKPACRKCPDHCYSDDYKEKIQEVMKFSGPYLIRKGRLGLLLHFLK